MALQKYTKILRVFSFFNVQSPDLFLYRWLYPTIIFIIIIALIYFFGDSNLDFSNDKLIDDINSLMGILTGFYMVALAAVASFPKSYIDNELKGRTPKLKDLRQGKQILEPLTRRRFLTVIFGYCAILSILLYVVGISSIHLKIPQPDQDFFQLVLNRLEAIALMIYVWGISSLLVVTLLGLYYLVERIHRE